MAKTNRTVLTTNDQQFGDVADPNKLENSIEHAYDVIDGNDGEFVAHKSKQVDVTDTNTTKDKHVSNSDLKVIHDDLATKTDKTGNHEGTWRGLTPGEAAEPINGSRLDIIEGEHTNVERFNVVGDGITNVTQDIQSAFDDAAQNTKAVYIPSGDYLIDSITIPDGLTMFNYGKFIANSSSSTPLISVGSNVLINQIKVEIPTGIDIIALSSNAKSNLRIDKIDIDSVDQQDVSGQSKGVELIGISNAQIGRVDVKNYDSGLYIRSSDKVKVNSAEISNYRTGINITGESNYITIKDPFIHSTPYARGTYQNGWDGILIGEGSKNITIENPKVYDAPEHGIYFGGGGYTKPIEHVKIINPLVVNSYVNGIKLLGINGNDHKYIKIINPNVFDCSVDSNSSGIAVENVTEFEILNPIIKKLNNTYSCGWGIRLIQASEVRILKPIIKDTEDDSLFLNGGNLSNIEIISPYIDTANGGVDGFANGIRLQCGNSTFQNIYIKDAISKNTRYGLMIVAPDTGNYSNLFVTGDFRDNLVDWENGDTDSVVLVDIIATNTDDARDGSKINDITNGITYYKRGTWMQSQLIQIGTTANRPTASQGEMYFDTDLNKPIWYNGTDWVDSTGTIV